MEIKRRQTRVKLVLATVLGGRNNEFTNLRNQGKSSEEICVDTCTEANVFENRSEAGRTIMVTDSLKKVEIV